MMGPMGVLNHQVTVSNSIVVVCSHDLNLDLAEYDQFLRFVVDSPAQAALRCN